MKRATGTVLAGCGLVLFVAAHGFVAWRGVKLGATIGGWLPWIVGGGAMGFGLYRVTRHLRGTGRSHHRAGAQARGVGQVERGPHDGFLVDLGHGYVEITIFDAQGPPRFRLFFYDRRKGARPIPTNATITVETVRPNGARQTFSFRAEAECLESENDIPEPRAFTAIIRVSHGRHTHAPHEVQF